MTKKELEQEFENKRIHSARCDKAELMITKSKKLGFTCRSITPKRCKYSSNDDVRLHSWLIQFKVFLFEKFKMESFILPENGGYFFIIMDNKVNVKLEKSNFITEENLYGYEIDALIASIEWMVSYLTDK